MKTKTNGDRETGNPVEHTSVAGLHARGWTPKLIEQYLGEPDKLVSNPHHRSGPKIRLYAIERVTAVAARDEVRLALARAAERREKTSALAKGRAEAAREKIRSWAETIEIRVPTMPLAEATERAIAAYNEFNRERSGLAASSASDSAFLDRITLNFLRHRCTNYERLLDATFGKIGTGEAYDILRSRIIDAIVEVYPELAIAAAEQYLRTTFREG